MDLNEIQQTSIWGLYEKGRNFHRLMGIYTDTDRNYRMYNGDQWGGAKLAGVEPVQKNFIRPVVRYKLGVIHDNLYAIVFSSQNNESREFQKHAEKYTGMLNRYASRIWEKDKMDKKTRRVTKDAAINDEGILYINFDEESMLPVNEVIDKNDVYYGNENDDDIQNQPYILIRKRMPVANAEEFARAYGVSEEDLMYVRIGDSDTSDQSGEDAKYEVDDQVTIIYKMYKKDGTVHFAISTRYCDILEDTDLGIKLYPVAHFTWEEKKGSARGEGEVRFLIPNQIEVNRTEMRRVLTVKDQAYPMKIADASKISNINDLDTIGGIIYTQGSAVDDVHKILGTLQPAQMSPDVKQLQDDLIQVTRELAGAGEIVTGQVNPEQASGRAILAVQQAAQSPMTEQKEMFKAFIEDVALIWLEYLIVYSEDGINMEEEVTDPQTGEKYYQVVNVPQTVLEQLQATVKVDVTPKSVYDRFAQEQTIENLLLNGLLTAQRVSELRVYGELLDDDSVAPKEKILEAADKIEDNQRRIMEYQAQSQMMMQRAQQFLMGDPESQAQQVLQAQAEMEAEAELDEPIEGEEEVMDAEAELPEPEFIGDNPDDN